MSKSTWHRWLRVARELDEQGAEVLHDMIRANGLTQRKFAKLIGCTEEYVSYLVNGKSPVCLNFIERAAEVLS